MKPEDTANAPDSPVNPSPATMSDQPASQVPSSALGDGDTVPEPPPWRTTEPASTQAPGVILSQEMVRETPKPASRKLGKVFAIVGIAALLFVVSTVGALYALAYHKFELTSYPDLQKKVEFFVMDLPATPKSARYLLYKAVNTERNDTSQSFDISASVNTDSESADLLGLKNFDFAVSGDIDFKDRKNLLLNMNVSLTKDLNLDFKAKDKFLYFKINKVPAGLLAFAGLNTDNLAPLMNVWVSYDTTPLQTEARNLLDENDKSTTALDTDISKEIEKYIDETIMQKITVTKGDDNGTAVYKMHLDATPDMIDSISKKIAESAKKGSTTDLYVKPSGTSDKKVSDGLKNVTLDMWIDAYTYATRRTAITFKITPDSSLSESIRDSKVLGLSTSPIPSFNATMSVAMVMKFSDFGKVVSVEVPSDAVTFEEFSKRLSEIMLSMYTSKMPSDTLPPSIVP